MHDLINLNKFLTKSIGFEDLFNRFFELQDFNGGHPFYNIKRIKDDKYVLEMALAGYTKSDIKVEVRGLVFASTPKLDTLDLAPSIKQSKAPL